MAECSAHVQYDTEHNEIPKIHASRQPETTVNPNTLTTFYFIVFSISDILTYINNILMSFHTTQEPLPKYHCGNTRKWQLQWGLQVLQTVCILVNAHKL